MSASPYDAPLSDLRDAVENLAVYLAVWEARNEPDAHARRCAADVMDAVDRMLRELHQIRARLAGRSAPQMARPDNLVLHAGIG